MELQKCMRCGVFHIGNNGMCETCNIAEKKEMNMLEMYIDQKGILKSEYNNISLGKIALETGLSAEKIERYINNVE